jgi:hypothetical protein
MITMTPYRRILGSKLDQDGVTVIMAAQIMMGVS